MANVNDYVLLSNDSYESVATPPTKLDGWGRVSIQGMNGTANENGFYGVAYKKGNEVIIAYRGSDDSPDIDDDVAAYAGQQVGQITTAQAFYDAVRAELGQSVTISFTGHSLGGGLAGAMAFRTGLAATTFSAIPMASSVSLSVTEFVKDPFANSPHYVQQPGALAGMMKNPSYIEPTDNKNATENDAATYTSVKNYALFGDIANWNVATDSYDYIGYRVTLLDDLLSNQNFDSISSYDKDDIVGGWGYIPNIFGSSDTGIDTDNAVLLHFLGITSVAKLYSSDLPDILENAPTALRQPLNTLAQQFAPQPRA